MSNKMSRVIATICNNGNRAQKSQSNCDNNGPEDGCCIFTLRSRCVWCSDISWIGWLLLWFGKIIDGSLGGVGVL